MRAGGVADVTDSSVPSASGDSTESAPHGGTLWTNRIPLRMLCDACDSQNGSRCTTRHLSRPRLTGRRRSRQTRRTVCGPEAASVILHNAARVGAPETTFVAPAGYLPAGDKYAGQPTIRLLVTSELVSSEAAPRLIEHPASRRAVMKFLSGPTKTVLLTNERRRVSPGFLR